ncbi:MAG: hypothetical protein A2Y33_10250 [Spirochaetes bacterium GWF1_51_8]|nr:MAG: hypothetical protein A2Y33_10250 [Spirochaetes bacterium GWF1_51_8]
MPGLRNLLHRLYRRLESDTHELLYLFFEITRKCNLSCRHCGSDCTAQSAAGELTGGSWLKIVDYFTERYSSDLMFVITGGEPLVSPDMERIGERIARAGRRWGFVTNCQLLTRDRLNKLVDCGLYSITVSLDGPREEHDFLRHKKGAFNNVIRALGYIAEARIPQFDVVTCVYPGNLGKLDETASILLENKVPAWRLFRIFPNGRAKDNPELLVDFEATRRMIDWIVARRPYYAGKGLALDYSCEGYLHPSVDRKVRRNSFFCRAGVNIASILCDGTITGCPNNSPMFYEGNIVGNDFSDIWENGFGKFRRRDWMRKGLCADCGSFAECRGSSIHLWHDEDRGIEFCYLHEKH